MIDSEGEIGLLLANGAGMSMNGTGGSSGALPDTIVSRSKRYLKTKKQLHIGRTTNGSEFIMGSGGGKT